MAEPQDTEAKPVDTQGKQLRLFREGRQSLKEAIADWFGTQTPAHEAPPDGQKQET